MIVRSTTTGMESRSPPRPRMPSNKTDNVGAYARDRSQGCGPDDDPECNLGARTLVLELADSRPLGICVNRGEVVKTVIGYTVGLIVVSLTAGGTAAADEALGPPQ